MIIKTKILLLIILSGMSLTTFSQDYDPIIKEDSFWDIKTTVFVSSCASSNIQSIKRIQIDGDTIINNKTYKKLKSVSIEDSDSSDPCILPPLYVNSDNFTPIENTYLREDINEKRLYILTDFTGSSIQEYTVCDFSLSIGDTLNNYFGYGNSEPELILEDIKTNEEGRKVFYMNDGSNYTEGIGRNEGNLNVYFNLVDGTYERLYCYGNSQNQNNCAEVLNIKKNNFTSLKIFPNPVNNILNIQNTKNFTLKIFSTTGFLLKTINANSNLEIDVSSFASGIYFLEISNLKGKQRKKIIKL